MSAAVHEPGWCETVLRLRVGEHAPRGYEIKRVIGTYQQRTGGGTNYEDVYVVACRATPAAGGSAGTGDSTA